MDTYAPVDAPGTLSVQGSWHPQQTRRTVVLEHRWSAIVVALVLAAGCSSVAGGPPASSSRLRAQEDCLRTGGAWREVLTFCEYR
jgi:hypothetical protein